MFDLMSYPSKGIIGPKRGINLLDRIFDMLPDEAIFLRNYIFKGDSLVQRWPFRDYNASVTSFTAPFRGVHSYKLPGESDQTILFAEEDGEIKSFANPPVLKYTFPTTGKDVDFTTAYEAVVAVNGQDSPAVGRTSGAWRTFGSPAAVTSLNVTQNAGAGIAAGSYLHIVIPVIEVGGIGQVFANWSNVFQSVVAAPIASFSGTFTYPTDARVSACYVYRTLVNGSVFNFVSRVTSGAFTDANLDAALPVSSSVAPAFPSPQNKSWGVPLSARQVAFCGNRVVLALKDFTNKLQTSQIGATGYECEGFPADGSTIVSLPKDGDITAMFPIGETGEGAVRANHLFIGQPDSCYILPETNPALPVQVISSNVGIIGQRAIAQWKNWLFFQGRQGVYLWPGTGQNLYLLSDKITPVFNGGGSQNLAGNSGSDNIQYEVYDNTLWITVKSDSSLSHPNKMYTLDLLFLERNFNPLSPGLGARFTGPIESLSEGLSFGRIHRTINNEFLVLDSKNSRFMQYVVNNNTKDKIAGTEVNMRLQVLSGPLLKENPISQKTIFRVESFRYSGEETTCTLFTEMGSSYSSFPLVPQLALSFSWTDINWTDINWVEADWISTGVPNFLTSVGRWFLLEENKEVSTVQDAFSGWILYFTGFKQLGVFR